MHKMRNLQPLDFGDRLYRVAIRYLRRILPKTFWADRLIALIEFLKCHRRFPEKDPRRYSDHLFALRTKGTLYDPLRQFVTDKEFVKLYVAAMVGVEYNIQTFQILRTKDDVESLMLDRFPCVLKPTNGAGRIHICRHANELPDAETLRQWMDVDFYEDTREQNYRYLRQKIIVEEFLSEDGRTPAKNFKIWCFHGRPGFIRIESGQTAEYTRTFYDLNWRVMPVSIRHPRGVGEDVKPPMLDQMIDLATQLSAPFDFIRVDLYATLTDLRVGELTNCPGRAIGEVTPPEAQFFLGKFFEQPRRKRGVRGLGQSASPASELEAAGERRRSKRSG